MADTSTATDPCRAVRWVVILNVRCHVAISDTAQTALGILAILALGTHVVVGKTIRHCRATRASHARFAARASHTGTAARASHARFAARAASAGVGLGVLSAPPEEQTETYEKRP